MGRGQRGEAGSPDECTVTCLPDENQGQWQERGPYCRMRAPARRSPAACARPLWCPQAGAPWSAWLLCPPAPGSMTPCLAQSGAVHVCCLDEFTHSQQTRRTGPEQEVGPESLQSFRSLGQAGLSPWRSPMKKAGGDNNSALRDGKVSRHVFIEWLCGPAVQVVM